MDDRLRALLRLFSQSSAPSTAQRELGREIGTQATGSLWASDRKSTTPGWTMEAQHQSLVLDRSRSNLQFASWRLTRGLVKSAHALGLGGAVATQEAETDYIHTRLAALHNHLHAQPGGLYLFLRTAEGVALARLPAGAADTQLESLAGEAAKRGALTGQCCAAPGAACWQPAPQGWEAAAVN